LSLTYKDRALPALTIHTAVAQSKRYFVKAASPRVKTWGPTITGLAIVPILPYLFDHPVEKATDYTFDWIRRKLIERRQAESQDKQEL
jgi:fission process protein 1